MFSVFVLLLVFPFLSHFVHSAVAIPECIDANEINLFSDLLERLEFELDVHRKTGSALIEKCRWAQNSLMTSLNAVEHIATEENSTDGKIEAKKEDIFMHAGNLKISEIDRRLENFLSDCLENFESCSNLQKYQEMWAEDNDDFKRLSEKVSLKLEELNSKFFKLVDALNSASYGCKFELERQFQNVERCLQEKKNYLAQNEQRLKTLITADYKIEYMLRIIWRLRLLLSDFLGVPRKMSNDARIKISLCENINKIEEKMNENKCIKLGAYDRPYAFKKYAVSVAVVRKKISSKWGMEEGFAVIDALKFPTVETSRITSRKGSFTRMVIKICYELIGKLAKAHPTVSIDSEIDDFEETFFWIEELLKSSMKMFWSFNLYISHGQVPFPEISLKYEDWFKELFWKNLNEERLQLLAEQKTSKIACVSYKKELRTVKADCQQKAEKIKILESECQSQKKKLDDNTKTLMKNTEELEKMQQDLNRKVESKKAQPSAARRLKEPVVNDQEIKELRESNDKLKASLECSQKQYSDALELLKNKAGLEDSLKFSEKQYLELSKNKAGLEDSLKTAQKQYLDALEVSKASAASLAVCKRDIRERDEKIDGLMAELKKVNEIPVQKDNTKIKKAPFFSVARFEWKCPCSAFAVDDKIKSEMAWLVPCGVILMVVILIGMSSTKKKKSMETEASGYERHSEYADVYDQDDGGYDRRNFVKIIDTESASPRPWPMART